MDGYIVHNSVRYILYYFCVSLLDEDLKKYCNNVRTLSGLRKEDESGKRFPYSYSLEFELSNLFFKNIKYPLALNSLISGNFYIKSFFGNRQIINLHHIESLIDHSSEIYNFSILELE